MFASAVFSDFENCILMTSWWPFCIKPLGHSHICIWALIFFKVSYDVAYIMALFAIENQQDREISSIQNGVTLIGSAAILDPKIKNFAKRINKGSNYIEFDPLNNNLTVIS